MTFKVVVMLAGPDDNKTVSMMVVSMPGSQPTVIFDPNTYLYKITTPSGINQGGYITTRVNLTAGYDSADNFLFPGSSSSS